jgi:kumamolisin
MIRRIGRFSMAIAALIAAVSMAGHAQTLMTRHTREAAVSGQAQSIGRLPASQVLQLDVVLPLRDQAGLDKFLEEVKDPSSSSYRHFLTPAEFTAKFGPSEADYEVVVRYLKSNGFTVVGG